MISKNMIRTLLLILMLSGVSVLSACLSPEPPSPSALPDPAGAGGATPEATLTPEAGAAWRGIPVMPDASVLHEEGNRYTFSIEGMMGNVMMFYYEKMPPIGWQSLGEGVGPNHMQLTFVKGTEMLTILVSYKPEENISQVELSLP